MSLADSALVFGGAASVLTWGGVRLSRAGDEIAERAGLSRLFVGMLLVAGATSLPEIVTDASAAVADAPDLAVTACSCWP
jgi:cation:H+ antiporter